MAVAWVKDSVATSGIVGEALGVSINTYSVTGKPGRKELSCHTL